VATSYIVGRPDATIFQEPTDFDAWQPQVETGPSPLGTGYTLKLGINGNDEMERTPFGPYREKGDFTQTYYVDDTALTMRSDQVFGEHRYVEYVTTDGYKDDILYCYYASATARPACRNIVNENAELKDLGLKSSFARRFPSISGKVADGAFAGPRTDSRLIAGFKATCYELVGGLSCYYQDWTAINVYSDSASTVIQATEVTAAKPDAALFVRPTDYDAWTQ
jgi:hypothetical protein